MFSTLGNPTPLFLSVGHQKNSLFPCDSTILDVFSNVVFPGDAQLTNLACSLSLFCSSCLLHPLYMSPVNFVTFFSCMLQVPVAVGFWADCRVHSGKVFLGTLQNETTVSIKQSYCFTFLSPSYNTVCLGVFM